MVLVCSIAHLGMQRTNSLFQMGKFISGACLFTETIAIRIVVQSLLWWYNT